MVLTNGFAKKTQKTPKQEIELAEQRKKIYLEESKFGSRDRNDRSAQPRRRRPIMQDFCAISLL
ncbi:MAG: type II toxin-antitoxin system RelE/ParE family toxin [Coraliomargarita sp.]